MRTVIAAIHSLQALASECRRAHVPKAVGNHGRLLDLKPGAKEYADRNTDPLIYRLVASQLRDDARIKFNIDRSGESIFRVYGQTFLLTHGDRLGTRGGEGIIGAIGKVMWGMFKTQKSLDSLGIRPDTIPMGHWHQSLYLQGITVNGSLKGPDPSDGPPAARHHLPTAAVPSERALP